MAASLSPAPRTTPCGSGRWTQAARCACWRATRPLSGVWPGARMARLALSGSEDNTVRIWEVDTGRSLRVLEGHSDRVWSVAWSPDGRLALSGSADNTVRIWEVDTGRSLRVLEGHSGTLWSVAWSPDGRLALSAALNGVMRLWNWTTEPA